MPVRVRPVALGLFGGLLSLQDPRPRDVSAGMRRKRIHGIPGDEPQTDVSSLVDVSFLLLIFFLVTSTIMKRENDLPMTIPTPGETKAIPTLPLWIGIAADGTVSQGQNEGAMVVADPAAGSSLDGLTVHLKMARDASRPDSSGASREWSPENTPDRITAPRSWRREPAGKGVSTSSLSEPRP